MTASTFLSAIQPKRSETSFWPHASNKASTSGQQSALLRLGTITSWFASHAMLMQGAWLYTLDICWYVIKRISIAQMYERLFTLREDTNSCTGLQSASAHLACHRWCQFDVLDKQCYCLHGKQGRVSRLSSQPWQCVQCRKSRGAPGSHQITYVLSIGTVQV